jgi:hypothetical protein
MQLNPHLTAQEVGDALAVITLGGDPKELAHALTMTAAIETSEAARGRLRRAAVALQFAACAHAAMLAELSNGSAGQ